MSPARFPNMSVFICKCEVEPLYLTAKSWVSVSSHLIALTALYSGTLYPFPHCPFLPFLSGCFFFWFCFSQRIVSSYTLLGVDLCFCRCHTSWWHLNWFCALTRPSCLSSGFFLLPLYASSLKSPLSFLTLSKQEKINQMWNVNDPIIALRSLCSHRAGAAVAERWKEGSVFSCAFGNR